MVKITLFDCNCPSCTSGVATFYVDDINKFKESWFKLEVEEPVKERFLRSLSGEIVTDYYSDSPEYNIVQEDKNAQIIRTEKLHYNNSKFTLINAYGWSSDILVQDAEFAIRYICFQGKYIMTGSYKLSGVAALDECCGGYDRRYVYGNPVLETRYHSYVAFDRGKPLYDIGDFSNFKDDTIQSICYLPMRGFDTLKKLKSYKVKKKDLIILMRDIAGEAG